MSTCTVLERTLVDAYGEPIDLEENDIYGVPIGERVIKDKDLSKINFVGCQFTRTIFKNCDFSRARFHQCTFRNVEFINCNMPELALSQSKLNLAVFTDCYMVKVYMVDVEFLASNFANCDMSQGSISRTVLQRTQIDNIDFSTTSFSRAVLENSDITSCDFTYARLYIRASGGCIHDSDFTKANVSDLYLANTSITGDSNIYILGADNRGYHAYLVIDSETGKPRILAGCRDFTIKDAKAHWEDRHYNEPVLQTQCLAWVTLARKLVQIHKDKQRKTLDTNA